jgi:hypothetical protein
MRSFGRTLLALGGWWWIAGAYAQEVEEAPEAGPDLDFLEYLGAWAEDDDEWLAIEEWQKDNREDRERESPEEKPKDEDHEGE